MRALALAFVPFFACAGPGGNVTPVDDTDDTDLDSETDTDPVDTDTDPPETDDDGDGWSIEDGDCDDTTVWVNPSMPEKKDDNLDNDCDGRTDEVFDGVRVFQSGVTSQIFTVTPFGDVAKDETITLSEPLYVTAAAEDTVDGGYVVTDPSGKVAHIAEDGTVEVWWDDSETEYGPTDAPLGWFGGDWSPLGYYLLTGANRLWLVEPGKPAVIAARWKCLEPETNETDICPLDVAVDPQTGLVAMLGYFGGYAEWTPGSETIDVVVKDNVEEPVAMMYKAAAYERSKGFYGYGVAMVGEEAVTGIYRFNKEANEYKLKGAWDLSYGIDDFTIEGESGDLYFGTHGGWDDNVYRMSGDGTFVGQLFTTAQDVPASDRVYGAVLIQWKQDP